MGLAAAVLLAGAGRSQTSGIDSATLDQAVTAVGRVVASGGRSAERTGSGVILSADGLVVTCYHVVREEGSSQAAPRILFSPVDSADIFQTAAPKSSFQLQMVAAAPEYDLALLRIVAQGDGKSLDKTKAFPFLKLGKSPELRLLDPVYVIGFPEVGGETVTAILGRIAGKDVANRWIKLDAAISRGFSGGAVVNPKGELVAIPTEIRADVADLLSDPGLSGGKALYGILSWVRPAEVIPPLLTAPREAGLAVKEKSRGALQGRVLSSDGQPLPGALIGLLTFGSSYATRENLLSYTRTDEKGEFILRTEPGTYSIRVHLAGYSPDVRSIEISAKTAVEVKLNRLPPEPPADREKKN